MLVVLGRPGAGCSTLLKTISGETHGFHIQDETCINYQGIPFNQMHKDFRGEVIYNAEVDVHFPNLVTFIRSQFHPSCFPDIFIFLA
jgi:ATP-binding cassette, subfamily G (WHITE), member 2, PDR